MAALAGPGRHPAAWMPAGWSVALLSALLLVVAVVNEHAPEAYMDEPFHVPATQRYCTGDLLTWDPKITTFPGLYVLGAAYAWLTRAAAGWAGASLDAACSTAHLRSVNALLALACLQLAHAISYELQRRSWLRASRRRRQGGRGPQQQQQQQQQQQEQEQPAAPGADADAAMRRSALAVALVVWLLPSQAFFSFLFYTDVASMAGLLLAQLLLLRGAHAGAALASAAAVGVRQTNAVWVALMAGGAMLEDILGGGLGQEGAAAGAGGAAASGREEGRGRRGKGGGAAAAAGVGGAEEGEDEEPASLLGELRAALPAAWRLRRALLARYWALLAVPAAFVCFVAWNGGVTVGDREAHAPVRHLAQPLYFGLFALAAAGPLLLAPACGGGAAGLLAAAARLPVAEAAAAAAAAALAAAAVARGTLAHPYLLADNRHYTFYLWRRVFDRHWAARYALVPLELLGWRLLLRGLAASQRRLWVAAYAAAVVVTLVPAWLVEFRYFTPGLVLGLLHAWAPASADAAAAAALLGGPRRAAAANAAALGVVGAGYLAVNAAALYVFLARPFAWPDGSVARFMW